MTIRCVSNPLSGFVAGKVSERGSNNRRIVTKQANSGIALSAEKATGSASRVVVVGCKALLHAFLCLACAFALADRAYAILLIEKLVVFVRLHTKALSSSAICAYSIVLLTVRVSPRGLLDRSARPAKTLKAIDLRSSFREVCDWLYFLACTAPLKTFGSFWPSLGKVVMPKQVIQWLTLNPSKACSISWGNVCLAATTALAKPFLYIGHYVLLVLARKTTITQV